MDKRILFVISDTGGGHRSAANAIIAALAQAGSKTDCKLIDLLRVSQLPVIRNAPEIYGFFSSSNIWLYNLIFRLSNFSGFMNLASNFLYQFAKNHIRQTISGFAPDLVVVIHPLAVRPICDFRDETNSDWPIVTVVTDLASIHASWGSPRADLYLLPTSQARQRIIQLGVPAEKIRVTGFPVHPRFINAKYDQAQIRQQLGFPIDRFTVLLTSGGAGGGQVRELVEAIEQHCPECILLVVTGRNDSMFRLLNQRTAAPPNSFFFQFVDNMDQLMAACDVVVTKAGPGTIMEAASSQRQLILTGAVGLQEEGNLDFVTGNGLGTFCKTPVAVAHELARMSSLRNTPGSPSTLQQSFSGAETIARVLLNLLS